MWGSSVLTRRVRCRRYRTSPTLVPRPAASRRRVAVERNGRHKAKGTAKRLPTSALRSSRAPLLSCSSPLLSAPLRSSPLLSAPLLSAPLLSAPLRSSPLLSASLRSSGLTCHPTADPISHPNRRASASRRWQQRRHASGGAGAAVRLCSWRAASDPWGAPTGLQGAHPARYLALTLTLTLQPQHSPSPLTLATHLHHSPSSLATHHQPYLGQHSSGPPPTRPCLAHPNPEPEPDPRPGPLRFRCSLG